MRGLVIDRRGVVAGLAMAAAWAPASAGDAAWRKLPTEPYRGKQDDIAFGSVNRGWYGNGEGRIFRTDDGGDSWRQVWRKEGTFVRALGFLDAEVGIMGNVGVGAFPNVTDEAPLYRTSDGGLSWNPVTAIDGPAPGGICGIEVARFPVIDRGERGEQVVVHAAGRVGGPAHYLRSLDRGISWTSRDLGGLTAAIYDVKFSSPRIGFIAGSSSPDLAQARGLILRTDDGGDSWREVFRSARPVETVWKLHFPTPAVGYGTIQSYDPDPAQVRRFIVRSDDGGDTWRELPLVDNAAWRSFGIGFADARRGWVGGNLGGLETRDGGETWSPVEFGKAVNKIRIVRQPGGGARVYAIGVEVHRLELSA